LKEKFQEAQEILKKYGQEHLLIQYNNLPDDKKEELLNDILAIDFEEINKLYEQTKHKIEFENSKIEPIDHVEKSKLSKEEYEHYEKLGIEAIKAGKVAAVTMAGGQGTRLGHNGPKGTYDIGLESHKSIFELLCDTLKLAKDRYGVYVPWYLMTSDENNDDTIKFFEDNNYFSYPKELIRFFIQDKMPMIDTNGKILLDENGMIKQAGAGHGAIFEAMRKNNIIEQMQNKGIEWIFIGGVDNILVKMVDPIFIGLSIEQNVMAAGKSAIKANPYEKVGVFCKRDNKPSVIEYSEISKELAEALDENGELLYGESHLLCNMFNIKILEKLSENKLPYHIAFKKASYMDENGKIVEPTEPNAYKFEEFIFDAFSYLPNMLIMRVKREEEFAPVKNAEGVDSPETARKLYKDFFNI